MPHSEWDLAVFDIAGTTVDEGHAVYASLEDSVRAAGATPSREDIAHWMGADKTEAITALLRQRDGAPASADELAVVYADFRARLAAAYEARPPQALPGVEAAISALRDAGVRVALSTGFSSEVTEQIIETIGWTEGVVDAIVSADQVGAGRPAPYMVFEAMRRTRVIDVRRVMTAGDTVLDLEAGTNAGAGLVLGVLSGAMTEDQLARSPHSALIPSVASIPEIYL